ncbi:glycosyltransferase family 4 protein [Peribacillus frigoritolerans]|uniref:glycosyltransferase family 4 protein n=1 Tax=Peribacillus frigoritolerans TaxID=450367 RepID=UPI0039A16914
MKKNKMNNKKKSLVVTTVASTLDQFCMNDINTLQESYNVYVAANFNSGNNTSKERVNEFKSELQKKNIILNEVNINRNPFNKSNISAYKKIKKLIEKNSFEIIHCHTPVAAMLVRLAARKVRKKGTRILYTAHGFHFYKGAPIMNWLLYYPIEKWLSKYTDILITINREDFQRAKTSFKAKKVKYIPGVGIDVNRFEQIKVNSLVKRQEIGVSKDSFVILSVGELNKNKNHETVIKALAKLNNSNVYYVICGQGVLKDYLIKLIKELGLETQIKLLGYRKDIGEICKVSDVFAFPSFREGLSVSLMEAMASGLPVVCSDIRGNSDLIEDRKGGYLIKSNDVTGYVDAIQRIYNNNSYKDSFGEFNKKAVEQFNIENVMSGMKKIYSEV